MTVPATIRPIPLLSVTTLSLAAYVIIPHQDGSPMAVAAIALTVLTIGLMATNALPEFIYASLFFAIALIFQIAPTEAVFSGFRSGAFWLVAGGVILGLAADTTGLGKVVAQVFLSRMENSLSSALIRLAIAATVLAFLIPAAIARVIILIPIVQATADAMGFVPGSRGRRAMLLCAIMISVFVPMGILPANSPNVLLAGLADSLYGVTLTYGHYLLMNFPISGLLKGVIIVAVILYWFSDQASLVETDPVERARLSPEAGRLAVIITLTVGMWATDVIHGIPPGFVAVTAAVVCLLPGIGVLTPRQIVTQRSGFIALLTIATIVGLGAVLSASGAGTLIANVLLATTDFEPTRQDYTYSVFSAINIIMMMLGSIPGAIAIITPFAGTVAGTAEIPVSAALMIVVNGYSTIFFPYQASPMLAGLRISNVSFTDGTKVTFVVSLISILTILPLTYVWWRWLGVFD